MLNILILRLGLLIIVIFQLWVNLDWGKTGNRFKGAALWNAVLSNDLNIDVSEAVYVTLLKRLVN